MREETIQGRNNNSGKGKNKKDTANGAKLKSMRNLRKGIEERKGLSLITYLDFNN